MLQHILRSVCLLWKILCFQWLLNNVLLASGNQAEFCESEIFQASCPEGETIMMTTAKYGRMKIGRCIKQSYGHIGCNVVVIDVLDSFCSGKRDCVLGANHQALLKKKKQSCPADFVAYLEASYDCIKVKYPADTDCHSTSSHNLKSLHGFISPKDSPGTPCPLRISVSPGQQVNITMFSFLPPPSTGQPLTSSSACYEVGSLKEGSVTKTMHKCLNDPRQKSLYLSNGEDVEISLADPSSLSVAGAFILHYAVLGCADPEILSNAKLQRSGNEARIECKTSNQVWILTCQGDSWHGDIGKCVTEAGWSFVGLFDNEHPFGTAIVVGIGATLGVLIGGILLYIIIAIFRKCENRDQPTYDYTDTTFAHIPTDYHAEKTGLIFPDDNVTFEQNSNTWGSQRHGNGNTLSRGGTDHSRVPLPPLPNVNNTLSYEKPLYNRNGNV